MKYHSVEQICKDFNIDPALSPKAIYKILNRLSKTVHPDVNPNSSDKDADILISINEAKNFLRLMNKQSLTVKSKTIDLVENINNRINIIEYEEKLTQRISNSSEKVFKMVKDYYFPKKIILIVFAVFVSLVFLIIAFTTNNLRVFFNVEYLNLIISFIWLVILIFMTLLFVDIIKTEFYIKRILNELENTELQFKIFSEFASELDRRRVFRKEVLELFVKQFVLNHYSDMRNIKKPYYYINDMVPKITDMIIFRAITKGFLEESKGSWYDEYAFLTDKKF